ncbi:hypothetical protein LPB140_00505 [Sphingorhabdus lutea]|uniref:Probable membrane transporter protein n=1 Tax=Sphingorhabdus lutea TaxID=1913578 RepID=A0A1L3J8Z3_9SPHN|nr:sulfite exporter TauE/SafE family protein [Sphingorhabdus lutea]APG61573.1 hypothetical protein LPB140_00505 [Sphingorhabdus lutea]
MAFWLFPAFMLIALFYASIGFGGGSSYNALLALSGADYRIYPAIALACNILVVTGGTFHFARAGHVKWRQILPLIISSIPMAMLGGMLYVPEIFFTLALSAALFASSLFILYPLTPINGLKLPKLNDPLPPSVNIWGSIAVGGFLGLVAGITAIGGGIFLAPILYYWRWGNAHQIAAACALFICVNSISGLAGQMIKITHAGLLSELSVYWTLLIAVFIGGQAGSIFTNKYLPEKMIRLLTAILLAFVSIQLLWRGYKIWYDI